MILSFKIDNYLKWYYRKGTSCSTSTETEDLLESVDSVTTAGKEYSHPFLKSLTALGKKKKPDFEKCPNDFLYYHYPNINSDDVKTVFSRFKSLTTCWSNRLC
jgi:hypothetical protein